MNTPSRADKFLEAGLYSNFFGNKKLRITYLNGLFSLYQNYACYLQDHKHSLY
jgi:hypothetical protein